jgi:hypothetical protein
MVKISYTIFLFKNFDKTATILILVNISKLENKIHNFSLTYCQDKSISSGLL